MVAIQRRNPLSLRGFVQWLMIWEGVKFGCALGPLLYPHSRGSLGALSGASPPTYE